MGGISGAFLLLPFQMSMLNYTAPSVTGTDHVFNIVAIPSVVYRYIIVLSKMLYGHEEARLYRDHQASSAPHEVKTFRKTPVIPSQGSNPG